MSDLNMTIVLAIIVIIFLLLILVIIYISNSKKEIKKEYKSTKIDYVPMPSSIGMFFPQNVERIGKREIIGIVKNIFSSYKYFDYKSMSLDELDKKEWHSWQVSLLLQCFKCDEEFFISNQKEIFHPFLLKASEDEVKSFMNSILKKYKNYVEINKSKDDLCKDYIWSNKDVSIIFYFLTNYKNYKK